MHAEFHEFKHGVSYSHDAPGTPTCLAALQLCSDNSNAWLLHTNQQAYSLQPSGKEMPSLPTLMVSSMAMHYLEHSIALTVCKFRRLQCDTMQQGGMAVTAADSAGNQCRISTRMYRTPLYVDCEAREADDPHSHS